MRMNETAALVKRANVRMNETTALVKRVNVRMNETDALLVDAKCAFSKASGPNLR